MARDDNQRVLRVGLIQGGKIVEEHFVRNRESVSIGPNSRDTFIVPLAGDFQKSITLFEYRSGAYQLVCHAGLQGRVSLGTEIVDVEELSNSARVTRRGGKEQLPLTDQARGKVVIGGLTLLFQFVDAPAVLARRQLPAAARGNLSATIDWTFANILIISFLLQAGLGVGMDVWWRQTGRYLPQEFSSRAEVLETLRATVKRRVKEEKKEKEEKEPEELPEIADLPPEPEPEPEPKKKKRKKKRKKKAASASSSASMPTSSAADRSSTKRKEQIKQDVAKKTIISRLVSAAPGGDGAISKLAIDPDRLASAMDGAVGGNAEATPGETSDRMFGGAPSQPKGSGGKYKKLSGKGDGKRLRTKKVKTKGKGTRSERKVSARVGGSTGSQSGVGTIDKRSVSKVFSRRRGAIRHCYERALQRNQGLKGKVRIRFTIGSVGRVTSAKATSNSTGDGSVGSCILKKLKSWKFPPASGGSVTFTHTFVLTPGG